MAHNMLAIMFDLCLKNMKVIWYYVGNYVIGEIGCKVQYEGCVSNYITNLFLFKPCKGTSWDNNSWKKWFLLWVDYIKWWWIYSKKWIAIFFVNYACNY